MVKNITVQRDIEWIFGNKNYSLKRKETLLNQFNDTYQLVPYLTDSHLVGEWRSYSSPLNTYEVYEKNQRITFEYWGGYIRHNEIHRKVFNKNKNFIDDEFITENHAIMMYEPLLEKPSE